MSKRPLVESSPRTPALAAATQRLLLLKGPIPACMIGYLVPTNSQNLDFIIISHLYYLIILLFISYSPFSKNSYFS
ncbi:MAG: hypothetical protein ACFFAT_11850 [Promethearchaeota archaeon]